MAAWKADELSKIGTSEEVDITPRPRRRPVTVWIVRDGDDLYVRSAVRGHNAAWYRAAQETREGQMSGGGVEKDIRFEAADPAINDELDAAYRIKYRRYAGRILNSCLTPEARSTTIRIVPL